MSVLRAQILFPVAISGAAAIGLLKTLLLAVLLEPADFGRYAAYLGIAIVATIFISFGRIERTTKAWPRAWEAGGSAYLVSDFAAATRLLSIRAIGLALAGSAAACLVWLTNLASPASAIGIAIGSLLIIPGAVLLLSASGLRAVGSMRQLLAFTAARSGLALAIAAPLAALAGWQWALAGELVAQSLVALWSWLSVRAAFAASRSDGVFAESASAAKDGRTLYASNLVGSLVPFGARGFIALIADAAMAGAYAVSMVFVQVAQMFSGSVAQREGPLVIKLAQRGEIGLLRQLIVPAFLLALLAGGSFAAYVASLSFPGAQDFWASYGLGPLAIGLTAIAMLAAFHMQLSFVLLALDGESHVLRGSILSAALTYAGFVAASSAGAGAAGFVAGVAMGESLRAAYMLFAYRTLRIARDRRGGANSDAVL